jgi:hypothetical protein
VGAYAKAGTASWGRKLHYLYLAQVKTSAHRYWPLLLVLSLLPRFAFALDIDLFVNTLVWGTVAFIVLFVLGAVSALKRIFKKK